MWTSFASRKVNHPLSQTAKSNPIKKGKEDEKGIDLKCAERDGAGRVGGAPTGQNQSNHLGGGAGAGRARTAWRAVGVDGAKGGRRGRR